MKKFLIMNIIKVAIVLNVIFLLGNVLVPPAIASESSVDFSWLPNSESNIVGYKIYYGTTAGGGYPNFVDIKSNIPDPKDGRMHGVVSGLTNGITYYFVCTAYNNSGDESAYSGEVVDTPGTTSTAVSGATATGTGTTTPKILTIQIKLL